MVTVHFSSDYKSLITPLLNIHFDKIYIPGKNFLFDKERFVLISKIIIKSEIAFIEKLHKDYFKHLSIDELKSLS